jgi:hypothetical protein
MASFGIGGTILVGVFFLADATWSRILSTFSFGKKYAGSYDIGPSPADQRC